MTTSATPSTTLHLVRHGETEWNTQRRMQGWRDSPLSPLGVRQASDLAARMRPLPISAVYSSSSPRALRTAEILSAGRALPLRADPALREMHFGAWEGRTHEEIVAREAERYHAFWHAPDRYDALDGETFAQVQARVLGVVARVLQRHRGQDVLIVTHTVALKVLLAAYEPRPFARLWEPPFIHPASHTILRAAPDGQVQIARYADQDWPPARQAAV